MTGIKDIHQLLKRISPVLHKGEFVFCTFASGEYGDWQGLRPIACLQEQEGLSMVIPRQNADQHRLSYCGMFKMITLQVHSSLKAVGLTAAVTTALSKKGIPANVMAGFYHDHIFVPSAKANEAVAALKDLGRFYIE
jgi:hypothetical protein